MRHLLPSLRMLLWFTAVCGLGYTVAVWAAGNALFPAQAQGSLIAGASGPVGSALIGQKFTAPKYFWGRPSAVDYNPQPSGGSNLGPTSAALKKAVDDRRTALLAANPGAGEPPQDLLFASASGLDPHISPEAAYYQVARVAKARGMDAAGEQALRALVAAHVEGPQWGVFGEERVNVLELNQALDAAH